MLKLGFDIGGTKIAGIALDAAGERVAEEDAPTPDNFPEFLRVLQHMVRGLAGGKTVAQIGLGLPGPVARDSGRVLAAVNVPYLAEIDTSEEISRFLGFPVQIANDADCFALSEAKDGAAAGVELVLGLILGTGVGSGLIAGGKLISGKHGLSGEWAHVPVPWRRAEDGPEVPCPCGRLGCINESVNARGLLQLFLKNGGEASDTAEISEKAKMGDAAAISTLIQYYDLLARCLIIPLQTIDPDIIVIGGGLSALPDLYDALPPLLAKYSLTKEYKPMLVPARWGPRSGLRGAAFLGS